MKLCFLIFAALSALASAEPLQKGKPAEVPHETAPATEAKNQAPPASLKPEQVAGFAENSSAIQKLLTYGLSLTEKKLTYQAASADPSEPGMDCSGFVYHVLQHCGWTKVPRQSNEMYAWAWKAGYFRAFNGKSLTSFELEELRPGDLLFWVNTTKTATDRDPPITHVMIYLGTEKESKRQVMIGSSDGRTYNGASRFGVGVFDFQLPRDGSAGRFIGYAHLPELTDDKNPKRTP